MILVPFLVGSNRQGRHARGGKYNYVINGNMIGGVRDGCVAGGIR
jgi:hypothetical protein